MHPSWRDLVIAQLAARSRRAPPLPRVLRRRRCRARPVGRRRGGRRARRPLLVEDADWDALGDGLHDLCAELDDPEAILLLQALAEAELDAEAEALTRLVLERLGWGGMAVSVDA